MEGSTLKRPAVVAALMLAVILSLGAGTAPTPSTAVVSAPSTASTTAKRASVIMWYQAKRYAGRTRTVKGRVKGTKYASASKGRPTFLNIGRKYPNRSRFTVVIWGKHRAAFPSRPEDMYRGKKVLATGRIRMYRGSAQMFIRSPSKLRIID